jgi:broad specificity phosphatase PhoE
MATVIVLARHGETDWNREHRLQGWADPPLNELGREQARELAESLAEERFDAIYSSDLRRAAETARVVGERLGLPVVEEPALREVDLGSWSGRLRHELHGERPDGESREQHRERVRRGILRLADMHPGGTLLVVSHGGSMRALEALATDEQPRLLANCEAIRLLVDDGQLILVEAPPPVAPRDPEADDAEALEQ